MKKKAIKTPKNSPTLQKGDRTEKEKAKKVTVKFFLHKSVSPQVEGRGKRYPLYALITYNRKNTMLRSHYGSYYKDLKEIDKLHYPGLLAFEERILTKTIRYEIARQHEDFDLKGIHKKYEAYCIGIDALFSLYLKNILWVAVLRSDPQEYRKALNFKDNDIRFETLYSICQKIYKGFNALLPKDFETEVKIYENFMKLYQGAFFQYSFPTVIEWLDQSAIEDYHKKLEQFHKRDKDMIDKSLGLLQKVVYTGLTI